MSSLGPLAPDHNPFADDQDETHTHDAATTSSGHAERSGAAALGAISNEDQAGLQQQHWDDQDQHLDALTASLNRQHEMSLQMNEELDLHQELLEEFDRDVDGTGLRLGGAANQLDRLRSSLRDHGKQPKRGSCSQERVEGILTDYLKRILFILCRYDVDSWSIDSQLDSVDSKIQVASVTARLFCDIGDQRFNYPINEIA